MRVDPIVLSLDSVGLYYRRGFKGPADFPVLQDVNLDIYRGETVGLVGRNGAGKSSLLRLLAGIVEADRGRFINHGCRPVLLSISVGFLPHLSGRQNAILSGMFLGLSRKQVEAKMDLIIEFSGLHEVIDLPIVGYSSGMKARLGFSVAIYADADVLLLDEVLGVGDLDFREKSSQAMKEKISANNTVVLASHSMNSIRELCDRVVWIENGTIKQLGNPEDVVNAYENQFGQPGKTNK